MAVIRKLETIANKLRLQIITSSYDAKTQHIGSCLSCVELLVGAYFSCFTTQINDPLRDRILFSKGHAALALYVTLQEKGFFSSEFLETFSKSSSILSEHPSLNLSLGIEISSGSLGHGLSLGVGMAAGLLMQDIFSKVVVLLSDGECNEGSVWEAALLAPKMAPNLIAVIDYNKWQATGKSNEITGLVPFREKWEAFGWQALEIDGHNMFQVVEAYALAKNSSKPTVIIANTVKGKGISFMEDNNNWHYRTLSEEEYKLAKEELIYEKCLCK